MPHVVSDVILADRRQEAGEDGLVVDAGHANVPNRRYLVRSRRAAKGSRLRGGRGEREDYELGRSKAPKECLKDAGSSGKRSADKCAPAIKVARRMRACMC